MRMPRWAPWIAEVMAGSPAISDVQTFADAGIRDKPCGHVITLRTGATIAIQWVRTSASGGEDQSLPEGDPITGEPPAAVEVPDLPASGRVPLTLIEAHLAALILGAQHPEIRAVERTSQRPGEKKCGINVTMHSGAVVYAVILHTAPAGAATTSGGVYQQREEV